MVQIQSVMVQIQSVMVRIQSVMVRIQSVMVRIQSVMVRIQSVMVRIQSVMVRIQSVMVRIQNRFDVFRFDLLSCVIWKMKGCQNTLMITLRAELLIIIDIENQRGLLYIYAIMNLDRTSQNCDKKGLSNFFTGDF